MGDAIQLLDGPLGTELLERGVPTPLPGWSAHALLDAPDVVRAIHRDYARAGARIHTTNTFRTRARVFPADWARLARVAVELARAGAGEGGAPVRIAGSIAPLEDCYRPDLSPAAARPEATLREHRELADVLAEAGCDLLLCETFPAVDEGLLAARAAVATGLETWVSFTPGPEADLLTPAELAEGARRAIDTGASAVLVNCVPARGAAVYVEALAAALDPAEGVAFGCYANAGRVDDRMGWTPAPEAPERYVRAAQAWVDAGATILGGCCGTGVGHVAALAARFVPPGT